MTRRLIDLIVATILIVCTAPVTGIIALCLRWNSSESIFYIPKMVGYRGQLFPFFRFRTMSSSIAPPSTTTADRITRVGHFLRTYSLDHLPTLFNVLFGDLSLVGPRAIEIDRVDMRDPVWKTYFSVKPGYFNYAVLKLGSDWTPRRVSHPSQNQELELDYIRSQSLLTDIRIAVRSLTAFVLSRGNIKERKAPDADVA